MKVRGLICGGGYTTTSQRDSLLSPTPPEESHSAALATGSRWHLVDCRSREVSRSREGQNGRGKGPVCDLKMPRSSLGRQVRPSARTLPMTTAGGLLHV